MADLLEVVRTQLLTHASVTDLVGQRIFIDGLPQQVQLPAVMLEDPDDDYETTLGGVRAPTRTRLHANAYGVTRSTAKAVCDALDAVLRVLSGTWSGLTIRSVHVSGRARATEPPRDGSQTFRHVHTLLCSVWHK